MRLFERQVYTFYNVLVCYQMLSANFYICNNYVLCEVTGKQLLYLYFYYFVYQHCEPNLYTTGYMLLKHLITSDFGENTNLILGENGLL